MNDKMLDAILAKVVAVLAIALWCALTIAAR